MKYTLLFGAGAEVVFGLPLGNVFALKSILKENDKLYDALSTNFESEKEKMFSRRDSIDFRICVFETIKKIKEKDNKSYKEFKLEKYYKFKNEEEFIENLEQSSIDSIKKLYDSIKNSSEQDFKEMFKDEKHPKGDLELICNRFEYRGNIEKYFYSLINKEKYGKGKYYKVFNYLWSSYFTILIPILKWSDNYKKFVEEDSIEYNEILKNIKEITQYIFSEDFLDKDKKPDNYYNNLLQFKNSIHCVMTTNYTPFVELYFKEALEKDSICYLSGRLDLFEDSNDNIVFTLDKTNRKKKYFPFIMTQSPIKPIINPIQIKEYYKAINKLEESDCLVVVGYSMCDNDYHILAIIKEFIQKKDKYLIYCSYCDKDDESIIKDRIEKDLRVFDDDVKDRILILKYDSQDDLYSEINKLMKEVK